MSKGKKKATNQAGKGSPARNGNTKISQNGTVTMAPFARASQLKPVWTVSSARDGRFLVRGQDMIMAVTGSGTQYLNLVNLMVSPQSLVPQGRLARFSELFERYRFTKLRFKFSSAVSSGTQGALVMSYDRDPSDPTPAASPAGLQEYMGHSDSTMFNVWLDAALDCVLGPCPQDGLFTNSFQTGDERLTYQGQLYVANGVAGTSASVVGALWVEYECEMWQPQLSSAVTASKISTTSGQVGDPLFGASKLTNSVLNVASRSVGAVQKTGIIVPPGRWELMSTLGNNAAGGANLAVLNEKLGSQGAVNLTATSDQFLSASPSVMQFARQVYEITDPEGAFFYFGNQTNAPSSASLALNRILSNIL